MFDKILVAIGGDDANYEPARAAGQLARLLGAQLTVLSVKRATTEALGEPYYTDLQSERLGDVQAQISRAKRIAEEEGAVVAGTEWLEGPPAKRIVDRAVEGGYKLIVLGSRRRGRLQTALLGSVSATVAAHSSVPVMIVPEHASGINNSGTGI